MKNGSRIFRNAYTYTWDHWDWIKTVALSGHTTVDYEHDANGAARAAVEGYEVSMSYWLGPNQIAEERELSAAAVRN